MLFEPNELIGYLLGGFAFGYAISWLLYVTRRAMISILGQ